MMQHIYKDYPYIKHIASLKKNNKIVYLIGETHVRQKDFPEDDIPIMTVIQNYGIKTPVIAETCFYCEHEYDSSPDYTHLLSIHKHQTKNKVPLFYWAGSNRCNTCDNVLSLSPEFNLILKDETYLHFFTYVQHLVYQTDGKIQFDYNKFQKNRPDFQKRTLLELKNKFQELAIPTFSVDAFLEAIEKKTDSIIQIDEFNINREINIYAEYLLSETQILIGKSLPLIKGLLVSRKSHNIPLLDAVLMIEEILSEDITIESANQMRMLFFKIGRFLIELETYGKLNTMLLNEVIVYFGFAHTENLQALLQYGGWKVIFEKHKEEFYAGEISATNWYQVNQHEITLEFLQGLKRSITIPEKKYLGDPGAKNIHM